MVLNTDSSSASSGYSGSCSAFLLFHASGDHLAAEDVGAGDVAVGLAVGIMGVLAGSAACTAEMWRRAAGAGWQENEAECAAGKSVWG